jgi:hypothetical protein
VSGAGAPPDKLLQPASGATRRLGDGPNQGLKNSDPRWRSPATAPEPIPPTTTVRAGPRQGLHRAALAVIVPQIGVAQRLDGHRLGIHHHKQRGRPEMPIHETIQSTILGYRNRDSHDLRSPSIRQAMPFDEYSEHMLITGCCQDCIAFFSWGRSRASCIVGANPCDGPHRGWSRRERGQARGPVLRERCSPDPNQRAADAAPGTKGDSSRSRLMI